MGMCSNRITEYNQSPAIFRAFQQRVFKKDQCVNLQVHQGRNGICFKMLKEKVE